MQDLNKYRYVCIKYLLSRVKYFNEPADELLDSSYRELKNLPARPVDDDQYNGLLGHRPVIEQRTSILNLLYEGLKSKDTVVKQDLALDSIVRYINKLKKRAGEYPYIELFKIDNVSIETKESLNNEYNLPSVYKTGNKGIELMHKYEGYRECTYKDPGSADGLPITGCVV